MTVPKTGVGGVTPRTQPSAETEAASPKGGEFDAVLGEKDVKRPAGKKAARPGPAGAGSAPSTDRRGCAGEKASGGRGRAGATGTAAPEPRAREAAAEQAMRDAEADLAPRTLTREGGGAPAGDLVRSSNVTGASTAPAFPDVARASDAAARIERVAEQIVLAAEVRLHGDGAVEARLQLDLGRLGRLHVALERSADGRIRVALEPTSAEGRELLRARGPELAHRLETRGLKLRALTVESSGETVLQIEGAGKEAAETAASRPAVPASDPTPAEPGAGREAPQRERSDEDHEHRGRRERHEFESTGEEEE